MQGLLRFYQPLVHLLPMLRQPVPDGQVLASAARDANGAASMQSAPSGNLAKRQRKKK